jgi:hypothetical protein
MPLAFSQNGGLARFKMRLGVKNPDKATQGFASAVCAWRTRTSRGKNKKAAEAALGEGFSCRDQATGFAT